jgi:hypothetical protein
MIEGLADAYEEVSHNLDALLVPVGLAWERVRRERPDLDLYIADGSHPNVHGTYLAACTFFVALTGRDPRGLSNAGMSEIEPEHARFLQEVAWQTVRPFLNGDTPGFAQE